MLSTSQRLAAIFTRIVDQVAVHMSVRFTEAGIDHVLLKGPTIAGWLYGDDEVRPYGDADFLIRRADWERAAEVLKAEGFEDELAKMAHPRMESFHSHPWRSKTKGDVDMHATLEGLDADMDVVWQELTARRETLQLPDGPVAMMAEAGRLLHIALHASQHRDGRPITDLERALERASDASWAEAAEPAARVDGVAAFLSGLRTRPEGDALIDRLGVRDIRSVETLLRAGQVPLAEGLHELSEAEGLRAKLRLGFHEAFPSPDFLRWWTPLARRGRLGLALAYAWRPLYLASRLPSALRALREARRRAT